LAFAFASLLLLIGGAAFAIGHGAERARQQVAELHAAHLKAGEALASIRANVFLGGILTRDYLLDPDPSHASRYAGQFNDIRTATAQNMQALLESGQSRETKEALDRLTSELENYWNSTRLVLYWTPEQKNAPVPPSCRIAFGTGRDRRSSATSGTTDDG